MAALEHEGYLLQPHTSAGRIPTEKGYRYFVDSLTGTTALDRGSADQVRAFFELTHGEIEQMLYDTSRLLSDLTDYAAVVVGPAQEVATVRSAQFVSLSPTVALFVAVLSNAVVEKRTIEDRLVAATAHLSAHLVDQHLSAITGLPASGDQSVDGVVAQTAQALSADHDVDAEHVFVGGAARMTEAFDAIETVRSVLTILEQPLVVVSLLRDVLDRGLQVAIGTETGMAPLAECSLVVAPYRVGGEPAGTIGVLGPTRMNYPQALAAVAVVSKRLGQRLSEG
jgi:heat-inducible transcriptional repressor